MARFVQWSPTVCSAFLRVAQLDRCLLDYWQFGATGVCLYPFWAGFLLLVVVVVVVVVAALRPSDTLGQLMTS